MNKKIKLLVIGSLSAMGTLSGADQFSFLFLGDLHYHYPEWQTANIVKDISEDVKQKGYKPDFVCHSGDFIENQVTGRPVSAEEGAREWQFAIDDIKKSFKIPFLMSLGNHDWYGDNTWFGGIKNIEKYYYPFMARELGRSLNGKPFFSFRWQNSFFLFTNHMGFDTGFDREQRLWLQKSLSYAEHNPAIEHVFIFGHPNLWNVNYFRFNENYELLDIISKFKKVDAYFCGHTHYNNASVWNFGPGTKLLQINGGCPSKTTQDPNLLPIGEQSLILNPPPSARGYTRGFGHLPSYFIVSVQGAEVTVALELIGGEKIWEFSWTKPGEIKEKLFLGRSADKILREEQLKEIKEARLHIFPYVPEVIRPECKPIEILINGQKAADLPRLSSEWEIARPNSLIKIPPEFIKLQNEIVITNPNKEHFAIRDCYLEVTLNDGKKVITPVYPYVLFTGNWKEIYMDFGLSHPVAGVLYSSVEANVPEELIKCSAITKKIIFKLDFKNK